MRSFSVEKVIAELKSLKLDLLKYRRYSKLQTTKLSAEEERELKATMDRITRRVSTDYNNTQSIILEGSAVLQRGGIFK